MYVICLGEDNTRSVLKGTECTDYESFSMNKLSSLLYLFSRELRQESVPGESGPAVAEAQTLELTGLQARYVSFSVLCHWCKRSAG